jgi:hypothetical protein
MKDDAARTLMMRFCATSGNCEFGMAQRTYGAEPLDLFRWSNAGIGPLIRMLHARFERIGDPAHVTVDTLPSGEFRVRHTGFNFNWHAFTTVNKNSAEEVQKREVSRLPFLARKMIEDLQAGERVFVVKWGPRTPPGIERKLLDAIRLYGSPQFLLVRDGAPLAVSRDEATGFLWGSVPRFADSARVPVTTDAESWLRLCQLALGDHVR